MRHFIGSVLLTGMLVAGPAWAHSLDVQGRLATAAGGPVADGTYPLAVAIYKDFAAPDPLFKEKFLAVPVAGGVFALALGEQDPFVKLDHTMFESGAAQWVGVQVAGEPELPRVRLNPVPYAFAANFAQKAADLECSGCVAEADLAKGAVTSDKIAAGAVKSEHVAFSYASSDDKGGSAKHALTADAAKLAESAKVADVAIKAESAAKSDEAGSAGVAKSLLCTGCVQGDHIAKKAITAAHLADDVAGKYLPLAGGTLTGDLVVQGGTLVKGLGVGAVAKHGWNEIQEFRVHVSDGEPVKCEANKAGALYFDSKQKSLVFCDGSAWVTTKPKVPLGTDPNEPGASCLAIKNAGPAASGVYWLDPNGGSASDAFQTWCEMSLGGGGWTLVYLAGNDGRPQKWTGNSAPITGAAFFGTAGTALGQVFDAAKNAKGDGIKQFSIVGKDLFTQSAKREVMMYMGGPADDYMTADLPAKCNPFDPASNCQEGGVTGLQVRDSKGNALTNNAQMCSGKGDPCGYNEFGFHMLDGPENNNCLCHSGAAGTGFQGIGRIWTTFNRSDGGHWDAAVHSAWKGDYDQPGALLIR
jgi:hypothetical protein